MTLKDLLRAIRRRPIDHDVFDRNIFLARDAQKSIFDNSALL